MLAAGHRLRRSSDFAATIRGGRRAGRGSLVVHLLEAPVTTAAQPVGAVASQRSSVARLVGAAVNQRSSGEPQAGFVVSKAVGGAVVRNTVRRRLRHLMRDRLAGLPPGTTIVVRALPGAASASYPQLGKDLDGALAAARSRARPRTLAGADSDRLHRRGAVTS